MSNKPSRVDEILKPQADSTNLVTECPNCKARIEFDPIEVQFLSGDDCVVEFYGNGSPDEPYTVGIVCFNPAKA